MSTYTTQAATWCTWFAPQWTLTCTTVDTEVMSAGLAEFAEAADVSPRRQVVLVLDGAGWHRSHTHVVPEGLHLVFLTPYSPSCNLLGARFR